MTPEEQRIAIAEACGWNEISKRCMWGLPPNAIDDGTEDCLRHFPKYESDLNAMHKAEKMLNEEQKERYFLNLVSLYGNLPKAIQATAKERAEAFLRALGLWEEAP